METSLKNSMLLVFLSILSCKPSQQHSDVASLEKKGGESYVMPTCQDSNNIEIYTADFDHVASLLQGQAGEEEKPSNIPNRLKNLSWPVAGCGGCPEDSEKFGIM